MLIVTINIADENLLYFNRICTSHSNVAKSSSPVSCGLLRRSSFILWFISTPVCILCIVNTSLGVLMTHVREQPECLVPKHPSDTRWSARADASEAFYKGCYQFQSALQEISLDATPHSTARNEADVLVKHMNTIEIALMCEHWNDILQRFNSSSKLL